MVSGRCAVQGIQSQSCDGRPTCVLEEFGCHGVVEVQVHVLVLQRTRNPPPHQRVSQLRRLEGGAVVLVAHTKRWSHDERFFQQCRKALAVEVVQGQMPSQCPKRRRTHELQPVRAGVRGEGAEEAGGGWRAALRLSARSSEMGAAAFVAAAPPPSPRRHASSPRTAHARHPPPSPSW